MKRLTVTQTSVKGHQLKLVRKTPADRRIKLTESKKKDKYLDLARELK